MGDIENRSPQLASVAAAFCALAFVAVALRCYVRIKLLHAFGIDDWFMVAALISYIINTACCISGAHYGTGRHRADLSPENFSMAMEFWWFCYLTFSTTMITAKVSIALFLLRLTPSALHRWIIHVATGLTVVSGIALFFIAMFQCNPVQFFWNRALPGGKCIEVDTILMITYVYSTASLITDWTLSILPMFTVWQLNMDLRTKLALVPVLSMACIASSAVCVRLAFLENFRLGDFLWDTVDIATWSQIEEGLAITAASLATLRPLFRIALGKFGLLSTGFELAPSGRANGNTNPNAASHARNGYPGRSDWNEISRRDKRRSQHSVFSLSGMNEREENEFPAESSDIVDDEYPTPNGGDYRVVITSNYRNQSKLYKPKNESEEGLNVQHIRLYISVRNQKYVAEQDGWLWPNFDVLAQSYLYKRIVQAGI